MNRSPLVALVARVPKEVWIALISGLLGIVGTLITVYGPRLLPPPPAPGSIALGQEIAASWVPGGNKHLKLEKGTRYWFVGQRAGDDCHIVLSRDASGQDIGPWVNCEDIGEPLMPDFTSTITGSVTIHLTDLSPEAGWETFQLLPDGNSGGSKELIPWMGRRDDSRGVVRLDYVTTEDGRDVNALLTHPQWVTKGAIKGWHPWTRLPRRAIFEAQIGFINDSQHTDGVTFMVWEHHFENGLRVGKLIASVKKGYTGNLQTIQADLSHLAGQLVSIELRVDAGQSVDDDWAVWVDPQITYVK